MEIILTPELQEFVDKHVDSGRYTSAAEFVLASLVLVQSWECEQNSKFEELKRELNEAIAQADRGELFTGEEVYEYLKPLPDYESS